MPAQGLGLKRPDKESEALQLHQYPSAHLPREWARPGERQYADILAATAHIVVSQGNFGHFWLRAGQNFLTLWADGGKLRDARGSRTLETRYYYSINRYHTVMAVAGMVTQTSSSWAQPIRISYFTGQVKKS